MKSVKIKGMAHITGGGLVENVPRVLPEGVQAVIDGKSWTRPAIFDWLQEKGNIDSHEMHRVFNNGIGLVVIVSAEDAEKARGAFEAQGEKVFTIGTVAKLPASSADRARIDLEVNTNDLFGKQRDLSCCFFYFRPLP